MEKIGGRRRERTLERVRSVICRRVSVVDKKCHPLI